MVRVEIFATAEGKNEPATIMTLTVRGDKAQDWVDRFNKASKLRDTGLHACIAEGSATTLEPETLLNMLVHAR